MEQAEDEDENRTQQATTQGHAGLTSAEPLPELRARTGLQTLSFTTSAQFRRWLEQNHAGPEGIWLRIFKKGAGEKTITYAEALDQALCFGWIDGQKRSLDERSWIQKFTPRRARSGWSKINTQHVARLQQAGLMAHAGLTAVAAAQADGRWAAAYDSARTAAPPEDFLQALDQDPPAKAFFATLNRVNRYAIAYRLQTAKKPETREKRMRQILGMLGRGEKFHP